MCACVNSNIKLSKDIKALRGSLNNKKYRNKNNSNKPLTHT